MTGGIRNPKQPAAIFYREPAVNVSSDFDDRTITGGGFPTRKRWRLLWNQRLLRQPSCCQIALEISPPGFQFLILLLQLHAQRMQT